MEFQPEKSTGRAKEKVRVLVVGCGNMGASHARAYASIEGFEIAGLVSLQDDRLTLADELGVEYTYVDYEKALAATRPDAVSICTYVDTHMPYALAALDAGAHVFVEKPLADTVENARLVVQKAEETGKKVQVGYILRHHPSWLKFVDIARTLGQPLVMRMNLNQRSSGKNWQRKLRVMDSTPPIVDCGVHYVDMMCLITRSRPVRVQAIGARLAEEMKEDMYNYGQLQVVFEDGSVGWYEAGWGPMVSETAFFVKDVWGPRGCVSIVGDDKGQSDDIASHTKTSRLRIHHAEFNADGEFAKKDETIDLSDEPDHQQLCTREQQFFLCALRDDLDMSAHLSDAVFSLQIVLAAERSIRTGQAIKMPHESAGWGNAQKTESEVRG